MKSPWFKWALFIFVFSIVGLRATMISYTDMKGRDFHRGDGYSDNNTHSAVRYFYEKGFWESKLRPMHNYQTKDEYAYTHYPAFPDLFVGVWAKIVGSTNESILRFGPILLSMFWFLLIFRFLETVLKDRKAALIGGFVLVTSSYFLFWADNLHKHMLEEFTKLLFVWGMWRYWFDRERLKHAGLLIFGLFVLSIIMANISFEVIPYAAVVTVGFSLVRAQGIKKVLHPLNVLLGLAFIGGFLLHVGLNAAYYGSWSAAWADLFQAMQARTGQCADGGCGLSLEQKMMLPLAALNRIERYYLIPGIAFFYFCYLALRKWKTESPENVKIFWVLFAASISWYFVMPQHAFVHHFVGKHWGILYGFAIGTGILEYQKVLKVQWAQGRIAVKAAHVFLCVYILAMLVTQQIIPNLWLYSVSALFRS